MSITAQEYRATGKARNKKQEESLQIQVATYLRHIHPEIIFRSDVAAGIKLSMFQAIKAKKMQSGRSYPDLFLAVKRGKYAGMYLELKKSREGVYLKNGQLSTNAHIQEQAAEHQRLRDAGYYAEFACGYTDAITKIEEYLETQ